MSIVVSDTPRIIAMRVTDDSITAELADGRSISVPVAWSWRLSEATPEQRNNFEIIGSGLGVHWPDIDEDISATGCSTAYRPDLARPRSVADAASNPNCDQRLFPLAANPDQFRPAQRRSSSRTLSISSCKTQDDRFQFSGIPIS